MSLYESRTSRAGQASVSGTVDLTPEPLKSDVTDFYRNVVAHLKTGAPLLVKPEEARVSTSILEAAVKSAKTGNVVRF